MRKDQRTSKAGTPPQAARGSAQAKARAKWGGEDVTPPHRVIPIHPTVAGRNGEAERAILGACMIAYEAWQRALDVLTPEDFADEHHEQIFAAMTEAPRHEHGEVEIVALNEELKRRGTLASIGGTAYTHDLLSGCTNAYNYDNYIRIVLECSLERQRQYIGVKLVSGELSAADGASRLQALEERWQRWYGTGSHPLGVRASDVEPQPVQWLWRRRLARGKLSIVDGDPGQGKGLLTMDLAARLSAGRAFPGDFGVSQEPRAVILISPEDDIDDTLVPRLMAARADLTRIHILNTLTETDPETGKLVERRISIPRDVLRIEELQRQTGAELLIIDPVMDCLDSGVKTHVDSEVREALMPLKHMATRTGLAVLLVRHFNKSGQGPAMYRGGGSIAFTALCRTAFIVAEHPDGEGKVAFLPVKSNIGKLPDGLTFSKMLVHEDAIPSIKWDAEPTQLNANDVLTTGPKQSAEQREILDLLRSGGVTLPTGPFEVALALGIGEDDKTGQLRIRQRLSRMQKAGTLVSPAYGKYDLPLKK